MYAPAALVVLLAFAVLIPATGSPDPAREADAEAMATSFLVYRDAVDRALTADGGTALPSDERIEDFLPPGYRPMGDFSARLHGATVLVCGRGTGAIPLLVSRVRARLRDSLNTGVARASGGGTVLEPGGSALPADVAPGTVVCRLTPAQGKRP